MEQHGALNFRCLRDLGAAKDTPRLRPVDPEWVQRLVAAGPDAWPPLLVDHAGRIADGWHRLAAAQAIGRDTLPVLVFCPANDAEFLEAAALANQHGQPLSSAQQKSAALRLLALDPQMSDRRIARAVGVSPTSVGTWRKAGVQTGHLDTTDPIRIGADGKHYPLRLVAPSDSDTTVPPRRGTLNRVRSTLTRCWLAVLRFFGHRPDRRGSSAANR